MKFHPYAEIFPLIEGADFDALVEDIRAHGLREKIWLYEGKILDGRNRFIACKKAKVEPATRQFKGDADAALAFVWSLNTQRRHLNASQRAFAASRYKEIVSANLHSGDAAETAAESMNVSRRSVFHADKVREKGSKELQRAVESGEVSVSKAAAVIDLPKPEQLKAAKQKAPFVEDELKPASTPAPEPDSDEPERPDIGEEEEAAALDRAEARAKADRERRIDTILQAEDQLAEAVKQIAQQAALIGVLETTRDGYMRGKEAVTKMLQTEQRKVAKLEKENKSLREQLAAMEGKAA